MVNSADAAQHVERLSPETWVGRPVRVHIFPRFRRDRVIARLMGNVSQARSESIQVKLLAPFEAGWQDGDLVVEVMLSQSILRFDSRCHPMGLIAATTTVTLSVPETIDALQRRQFMRADLAVPATLQPKGQGSAMKGTILNISAGGVGLLVSAELAIGTEVSLSFVTPEGVSYEELGGRVIRCVSTPEAHSVALQFVSLHPEVSAALDSYVNRLLYSAPPPVYTGKIRM